MWNLKTAGNGPECLRCMNINQISCHHFWIDPEMTARSHKLWFLHPKSLCWKRVCPRLVSNFLTRDDDDNDEISISFPLCPHVHDVVRDVVLSADWKSHVGLILQLCLLFFFGGFNAALAFALHNWLVAFNLCVKHGNLYDNGSRSDAGNWLEFSWVICLMKIFKVPLESRRSFQR